MGQMVCQGQEMAKAEEVKGCSKKTTERILRIETTLSSRNITELGLFSRNGPCKIDI